MASAKNTEIKEQTAELFRQHREAKDESTRIFIENEIILINIHLAVHKTKRFRHISISEDDIVAVATAGLFLAVRSYDYTKSAFATYAWYCIENEIIELIRKESRQKRSAFVPLSLNQDIAVEDHSVNVEEEFVNKQLFHELLNVCSAILSEFEFSVLKNYLLPRGERKSQSELGIFFSCSQTTIARTEKRSVRKLREFIANQEWGLELLRG